MRKTIITPIGLPAPRGFNHGILVSGGQLLFLAGQDGSDTNGQIVEPGDLLAQFEQVLANLEAVVKTAGGTMTDIVKLNIFVKSRDVYHANLRALGQLFRQYFGDYCPTMALFEVAGFFQEAALIEMEGFAVIDAQGQEAADAL